MSLNFKSWVMDGYQLADESYHGLKDKLYETKWICPICAEVKFHTLVAMFPCGQDHLLLPSY